MFVIYQVLHFIHQKNHILIPLRTQADFSDFHQVLVNFFGEANGALDVIGIITQCPRRQITPDSRSIWYALLDRCLRPTYH